MQHYPRTLLRLDDLGRNALDDRARGLSLEQGLLDGIDDLLLLLLLDWRGKLLEGGGRRGSTGRVQSMLDDGLLLLLDDLLNRCCLRDLDMLYLRLGLRLRRRRWVDRVSQRNDLRGSIGLGLDVGHHLGLVVAQGSDQHLLAVQVGQLKLSAGQLLRQTLTLAQLSRLLGRLDGLDLLRLTHHGLLNLDLDLLRLLRLLLLLLGCRHELVVYLLHLLNLLHLLVLLDLDRLIADDLLATSVVQNYSLTADHYLLTGRGHYLLYNLLSTSALVDHDLLR